MAKICDYDAIYLRSILIIWENIIFFRLMMFLRLSIKKYSAIRKTSHKIITFTSVVHSVM